MSTQKLDYIRAVDADKLQAAILSLPIDEQIKVIADLKAKFADKLAAQAKVERKTVALQRISAARSGSLAQRNSLGLLEGNLRRAGVTLESLVDKSLHEIDAIFAQSKMSTTDRMAAKSLLHNLRVIER